MHTFVCLCVCALKNSWLLLGEPILWYCSSRLQHFLLGLALSPDLPVDNVRAHAVVKEKGKNVEKMLFEVCILSFTVKLLCKYVRFNDEF